MRRTRRRTHPSLSPTLPPRPHPCRCHPDSPLLPSSRSCATILSVVLNQIGCTTAETEDGSVALEMLRSAEPGLYSIVLMDLRMPVMDGFEATHTIKKEKLTGAPIVALTAEEGFDTRQQCDEIGFDGFYSKPTGLEMLKSLLKQHLGYSLDPAS